MRALLLLAFLLLNPVPAQASDSLPIPRTEVLLTLTGNLDRTNAPGEARFDREMLEALGVVSLRTSTRFTDGPSTFEGVPLRAVLSRVGARGEMLRATALNDYSIVIPVNDTQYEPILAMRMDGKVLTPRDKGPLWIVFPRDDYPALMNGRGWDHKWVWQLDRLNVE